MLRSSVLAFAACDDDPSGPDVMTLELSFTGLEALGIVVDGLSAVQKSFEGDVVGKS